jgi:outer membrane receptor protein involved in Fe transport
VLHCLLLVALACSDAGPTMPMPGRVVDARSGEAVAGAEITIVGLRGSARTDRDGRFEWPITPPMPAIVIAVLRDGRIARPIWLNTAADAMELALDAVATIGESVVVTGTAPTIDTSPAASTTLLTARDLAMRHPSTLSQALDAVPGVSAISEGQAAVPAIRGMARGRTLILVDGNRALTERRAGANASFLDPALARTIEVARGPGSVAYGSDAFGGVIAIRTRAPEYDKTLHVRLAGSLGATAPEQRGELEATQGYGSGGLLLGVRVREFDDYEAPAGVVPNSSWRDRGVRARWEHSTAASVWSVGWQSDFGRALGRPRSDSDVMLATSPIEDSHRLTMSYERQAFGGLRNVRVNALAGGLRQRTVQERLPAQMRPKSVERADLSSREFELRLTGERLVGRTRVHVGSDVQRRAGLEALDTVETYNAAGLLVSDTTTVSIEDAHRTAAGVFAEAESQVTRTLRLTGGARMDAVRSANVAGFFGDRSTSNAAVAGVLAATLTPAPRLTLTTQIARGFHDPLLSDRFYRGPVGRGFIQGNPELKPEKSVQFDLSARYDAGRIQFAAAGYHYRITDLVERYQSTPTLFLVRNRGRADLQGVEIEGSAALPRGFTLAASAEASRGRDAVDHTPIDDVAPAAVSVTVRHALRQRLGSFVRVKAVGSHDAAGPGEVPTRNYTMLDAGFSQRLTRHLELSGVLRNILNESYQSSAGPRWVWAPGRHGSLTLVVRY